MNSFEYVKAASAQEAVRLLRGKIPSMPIAGGTDLLTRLKLGIIKPVRLVDIKSAGANGISFDEKTGLSLGALATLDEIAGSDPVRERYPALARAISAAASPQLRNRGTIGGNLLQGSRCRYYRGPFPCWLKGGEVCYARDGENEQHAIFGDGPCYAVHPSDPATALVALGAQVSIVGPGRERRAPVTELLKPPTARSRRVATVAADEIITEISVPAPSRNVRSTYVKATERRVWSFALASVAARLVVEDGMVKEAGIVLGGVAPTPWPWLAAAAMLVGNRLTDSVIRGAAEAAVAGAQPLAGNGYKVALVKGLVVQVLTELNSES